VAATLLVFALTWALIASRRLQVLPIGRPAGALLGAVGMVAVGALTPEQAYAAIDHDTLALLLGMMLISSYLQRTGFFSWSAHQALASAGRPVPLLLAVSWLSAALSAILVNDTVCLLLTPVVVDVCRRAKLPMGPYLIALATSANVGSAATLVGNPQNMLVGSLSGIGFGRFLWAAGLATLAALAVHSALLVLLFRGRLGDAPLPAHEGAAPELKAGVARVAVVGALVIGAFFAGFNLGWAALGGAVALMVLDRQEPRAALEAVDGSLLLFFAGLFVVVEGLDGTGLIAASWTAMAPWFSLADPGGVVAFTGFLTAGSNLVSNVPMVLLVGPQVEALGAGPAGWVLVAFVTTLAGNLTLVGSVANIIVAEGARESYHLGFWEYLRVGLPATLLGLLVGVPVLLWVGA
jgi:Na+/H+ antiporter NhaD/arsenite permease-like protein